MQNTTYLFCVRINHQSWKQRHIRYLQEYQISNIKYICFASKTLFWSSYYIKYVKLVTSNMSVWRQKYPPSVSTISNIWNWQHQIYLFCISTSVLELSPVNPWSQPCFLYLSFPASSQSSENLIYTIFENFSNKKKLGWVYIYFL